MVAVGERSVGEVIILRPVGRIDSQSASEFEMVINQKLNAAKDVILDLEEVPYVSSAGLRIVLMLAKRLGKTQGRFALTSIKPEILSVLRMAGLTSLLTIFDKPEGALQAFGAG